ncbi:MAG TPA: hypothetical protein PLL10_02065 [Elusimicrobiales bacterium]|nr:hypothetical protein [Elusimicrobiales bacterium]
MDIVNTFATAFSALATIVIAVWAYKSHKLAEEIKKSTDVQKKENDEYRTQVSDLYQAIAIATLISGPSSTGGADAAIKCFKNHYKGKTPVFKDEKKPSK